MLNFNGNGRPIARIHFNNSRRKLPLLYLADLESGGSMHSTNKLDKIDLNDIKNLENSTLIPLPSENKRDVIYVVGQSGSGKSFYIANFVKEYHKMFPKNKIYLFSPEIEDNSFEDIYKILNIVKLNDEILNEDISIDEFENSLVIFDDFEAINKKYQKFVVDLMNKMLTSGRKLNISLCIVKHVSNSGKDTQLLNLECTQVVLFPYFLNKRNLEYLCMNYLGLSKDDINTFLGWDTRPVTIIKGYPKVILGEKNAMIIKQMKL